MKVLIFILAMVLSTALMLGGIFLLVMQPPYPSTGIALWAYVALAVMVFVPVSIGSMRAYWNVDATEESRQFYQRWLWVVMGLEAVATVAIVVFAVLAGSALWLPVVFIAVQLLLIWLGLLVGNWLRRRDDAHPQPMSWAPVTRAEITRKITIIAGTFVATSIVAIVVLGLVGVDEESLPVEIHLLYTLSFASMAASFACMITTFSLNARLRDAAGRDVGTMRKVSKVVLRNKTMDLDENEQAAAARYAVVMPTTLGFTLGYFGLLCIGLGTQQVVRLVSGQTDAFTIGMGVVLVVTVAVLFPYYFVVMRRARTYARDHADLLPQPSSVNTAGLEPV